MRLAAFLPVLLLAFAVQAADAPAVDPALQKRSEEFLKLPAYELDRVNESNEATQEVRPDRVGDVVTLRVLDLKIPGVEKAGAELKVSVPEEDVVDQGWALLEPKLKSEQEVFFGIGVLKSGKIEIPSLLISAADGRKLGRTNPLTIEVQSAIAADDAKPTEAAEPRPPVSLNFPWVVVGATGFLLLLVFALLGYALYRWIRGAKPKPVPVVPAAPPRPEDELALEALLTLEKRGLCGEGKFKPHYFGVSEILKAYVGGRYRFDAQESTASELVHILRNEKGVGEELLRELESMFASLDLVKFTDHQPPVEEGPALLERARKLVLLTRRPKVELTPEPAMKGATHAS